MEIPGGKRKDGMRAVVMSLVVLGLAGSAACQRSSGVQSKAAVQEAIEEHLKQQSNVVLHNMTVEVGEVAFLGDAAEAQVTFRSKQAPNLAVGVEYKLRRSGKGWKVESSSSASMGGTNPHTNTATPTAPSSTNPSDIAPQPSH